MQDIVQQIYDFILFVIDAIKDLVAAVKGEDRKKKTTNEETTVA